MNNLDPDAEYKRSKKWITPLIILIVLLAGFIGWLLFIKSDNQNNNQNMQSNTNSAQPTNSNSSIDSLISYQLPADWKTVSCKTPNEVILIVPSGKVSPDCASLAGNWPIKFSLDFKNTKDCNQIKVNNQQVTNHTCSSKFIGGNKVLVSNTTYNKQSTYGKNTKVAEYYVITKSNVVKLEAADDEASAEDDYQPQVEQIANSIKSK
jgi:cytoskeletal protein RodZ